MGNIESAIGRPKRLEAYCSDRMVPAAYHVYVSHENDSQEKHKYVLEGNTLACGALLPPSGALFRGLNTVHKTALFFRC